MTADLADARFADAKLASVALVAGDTAAALAARARLTASYRPGSGGTQAVMDGRAWPAGCC